MTFKQLTERFKLKHRKDSGVAVSAKGTNITLNTSGSADGESIAIVFFESFDAARKAPIPKVR